jgi:hypothetical protein
LLAKLVRFTLERKRKKCQIFPFFEKPTKIVTKKKKKGQDHGRYVENMGMPK